MIICCGEQLDSTTGLYYLRARYMNPTTGTFITQDTCSGTIFDPTSLHKYLYANANPVMYSDPTGYFSLGDFNTASSINSILDSAANSSSQFALKFFKNFMKKMAFATIGGAIAAGDQWAAVVTDPDELAIAFRNGFLTGLVFSFASGKVAMALGGLCVIGGFAGAIKSFKDGNFWQGVYRLSLATLASVGLYKNYASNRGANTAKKSSDSLVKSREYDLMKESNIDAYTIKNKHLNSSGGNWSKFNVATEAEAQAIVKNAIQNGKITSIEFNKIGSNEQLSYKAVIETGQIIGTKGETSIVYIYDELGNVWTVYPE